MKALVVGIQKVDYVSRRTNEPVKGLTLHVTHPDANVNGDMAESVFVSDRLNCADLNNVIVGNTIDIEFGRRGFVEDVKIID